MRRRRRKGITVAPHNAHVVVVVDDFVDDTREEIDNDGRVFSGVTFDIILHHKKKLRRRW